ncbi:hypothetical protein CSKR_105680 [Clonorchis sinensis]|uniref:Uncharacterized protein n=2 Tax=Clonorchis sinensis TaxID=79923 RepID=H2KR81_CLOSI|nr:hypothetical protein CSKR_105680 [Clonorchis sinensis]GAA28045.2 hypothetical protein CLF_105648 [Clonorchis sinensis]
MGNSSGTLCAHVETKDQGTVKKAEATCKAEQTEPTPQTGDLGNQAQPETETTGEQPLQELATNDGNILDSIELDTLLEANRCCGDEQDITDIIDQLVQNALNAPVLADSIANIELWSLGSANQLEATPVDKGMHNFEPDTMLTKESELSASVNGTWLLPSSGGIPTTPSTPITTALMCESYEKEDNVVYLNHTQETDTIGENKVPFTIVDPNETTGDKPMQSDQQILTLASKNYDRDVLVQNININKRPEPIKIPLVHEVIPGHQTALSVRIPTWCNGAADVNGNLESDECFSSVDNTLLPKGLLRECRTLGHVVIDESSETYKYFENVGTDAPTERQDATAPIYVCAEEDSLDTVGLIGEFAGRSSTVDHQTLDFGCQTESELITDNKKTDLAGRDESGNRKDSEENTQPISGILRRRTVSQPNLKHYVNSEGSSVGEFTSSLEKDTIIECAQPTGVRNISQQTFSHPVVQVDDLSCSYGEASEIAKAPVSVPSNDAADNFHDSPSRIQARASFVVNITGTMSSADYPLTINAKCEGSIRAPNVNKKRNTTKELTQLVSVPPDRSSASSSCSSSSGPGSLSAKENSENAVTTRLTRNYASGSKLLGSTRQNQQGRKRDEAGDSVIRNSVKKRGSMEPVERDETAMSNLLQVLESVDDIELVRVDDKFSAYPDRKSKTALEGSAAFQDSKVAFPVEKCLKSVTEMAELSCSSVHGDQHNNNQNNGASLSESSSVLLERLKTPESVRVDHLDELSLSRYTMCC